MTNTLRLRQSIDLPPRLEGDFDHGDVLLSTGSIFIANTAAGTVEVVDGEHLRHQTTIPGCPEASGVLCAQDAIWHNHHAARLYVAIANPGVIEVVNTQTMTVEEQVATEVGAHTTAFDAQRQRLYVFLPSCRVAVYEEGGVP